jgi:hypothetical protein
MNQVPYDESLLDSNEFMKSYWERSTDNRNVAFVQDLRTEEVIDDFSELRSMSAGAFYDVDSDEAAVAEPEVPLVAETPEAPEVPEVPEVPVVNNEIGPKKKEPGTMKPKALELSTSAVFAWMFFLVSLLLGALLYMAYRRPHHQRL